MVHNRKQNKKMANQNTVMVIIQVEILIWSGYKYNTKNKT